MMHHEINITDEQRGNLRKLALYLLKTYPRNGKYPSFSMERYYFNFDKYFIEAPTCGTVCCAAGHGPAAGIGPRKNPAAIGCWMAYVNKYFCDSPSLMYDWCFHAHWQNWDNTPRGAAKRILYALTFGIPYVNFTEAVNLYTKTPLKKLI